MQTSNLTDGYIVVSRNDLGSNFFYKGKMRGAHRWVGALRYDEALILDEDGAKAVIAETQQDHVGRTLVIDRARRTPSGLIQYSKLPY